MVANEGLAAIRGGLITAGSWPAGEAAGRGSGKREKDVPGVHGRGSVASVPAGRSRNGWPE